MKINNTQIDMNYCKKYIKENVKDFKDFTPMLICKIEEFLKEDIVITKRKFEVIMKSFIKITDKKVNSNSRLYWIARGWSEEEATEKVSLLQRKKSKRSKEYWISKGHTETEAEFLVSEHQKKPYKKFKDNCEPDILEQKLKENSVWCKEYWIKRGYTEKQSSKKISEYQKNNASKINYGKRSPIPFQKDYWINKGYSEKDAIKIISENSDTRSLKSFVNRHGHLEGVKMYNKTINKFKNTVAMWDDEFRFLVNQKRSETMKKNIRFRPFNRQSKEGKRVCAKLYKKLRKESIIRGKEDFSCYVNGEIPLCNNDSVYFYDVCINNEIIVEYNGTPWHYDILFKEELDWFWRKGHHFSEITKEKCEEKDIKKKSLAEANGFKYYVVWDFQDTDKRIDKIVKEIKNGV